MDFLSLGPNAAPLIAGTLGLGAAILIVYLVRRDRLQASQAVRWIVVALGFALLGFAPSITDYVARMLGVGYPPVLALSVGIVVLVVKVLLMDMERSRMLVRHERLVQRLAIVEAAVNEKLAMQLPDAPSDTDGGQGNVPSGAGES